MNLPCSYQSNGSLLIAKVIYNPKGPIHVMLHKLTAPFSSNFKPTIFVVKKHIKSQRFNHFAKYGLECGGC